MLPEKSRNPDFPLARLVLRDTRKNNVKVYWQKNVFTLILREKPYDIFPLGFSMQFLCVLKCNFNGTRVRHSVKFLRDDFSMKIHGVR